MQSDDIDDFEDHDEDDDGEIDREAPDKSDWNDDPATHPCPYCKREVIEDAERCEHCGAYLSQEDGPKPLQWTWVVGVILLIAILLVWVTRL